MIDKNRREKMIVGCGVYHGVAEARATYDDVPEGTIGVVTAYLPECNKFAIFWSDEKFITYTMSEEEFDNHFKLSSMDEIEII